MLHSTSPHQESHQENLTPFSVLILTGLSGSGKSTVLRALEDIGYFCVDNLPLSLLPAFLQMQATAVQQGASTLWPTMIPSWRLCAWSALL